MFRGTQVALIVALLGLLNLSVSKTAFQNKKVYERIGKYETDTMTYFSVYTNDTLYSACLVYYRKLQVEAPSFKDITVLFYNKKRETPSSEELGFENKRITKYFIGGLEIARGMCYILRINENRGIRKEKSLKLLNEGNNQ